MICQIVDGVSDELLVVLKRYHSPVAKLLQAIGCNDGRHATSQLNYPCGFFFEDHCNEYRCEIRRDRPTPHWRQWMADLQNGKERKECLNLTILAALRFNDQL